MAWTTPVDYSTGQVITAAIWNNLIGSGGNIDETAPAKVTTAGDLVYGTGTNAIARLGIGSANQVLAVNSGATAPEWVAAAGGAWTLEGSITTEQTTTSTTDTVIATISSLNIPAGKPIMIIGQTRNSGGTANCTFFLGANGSAIGNSSNGQLAYADTLFSSGDSAVSLSIVYFGMRGSDYTARTTNATGSTQRDSTVTQLTKITTVAALPTAAITSIDIRGKTTNAAVTAIVGPTYVYSMAIA